MEEVSKIEFFLKGRCVIKGKASGPAVVSPEPISFLGGVNPATGILTEAGHTIEGTNFTGCVLVYPTGKGSTGGSNRIYDMSYRKKGPVAFIQRKAEPIATIGAIMAEIPVIDELDQDPIYTIKTGDFLEVDADNGIIKIIRKE